MTSQKPTPDDEAQRSAEFREKLKDSAEPGSAGSDGGKEGASTNDRELPPLMDRVPGLPR